MNNKTFVIAGGSTGIGREVVLELLRLGHNVVFGDIDVVNEVKDKQLISLRIDVTNVHDCEKLFKTAYETFGNIDGFFSYAGITPVQSLLDSTEEVYSNIFDVNVKGCIFCTKYAVKYMKEGNGGSIVYTGSPHSDAGEIDRVSYACSKGAVVTLANHIAKNYGKYNIRANYITLGWTPTEGELSLRKGQGLSKEDLEKKSSEIIPIGRLNTYDDVVPAIIYLLSNNSLMVSGSNIRITGGWFM